MVIRPVQQKHKLKHETRKYKRKRKQRQHSYDHERVFVQITSEFYLLLLCCADCYNFTCSLMEVYDEHVIDLLTFGTTLRNPIKVSEHPATGIRVHGRPVARSLAFDW